MTKLVILPLLVLSFSARALISVDPKPTNAAAVEQQRFLQFYDAEQSFQKKLNVGRERYNQKQVNRDRIIAGMSSQLQARQATIVNETEPKPDTGPMGMTPWLVAAAIALGFAGFIRYSRQLTQETPRQAQEIIPEPEPPEVPRNLAEETFFCRDSGVEGRGLYAKEGFMVLTGSFGHQENAPSIGAEPSTKWLITLLDTGVVRLEGDTVIFQKDHLFPSPSVAAMALMGRTANGWLEWRTEDGITLDTVERQQPRDMEVPQ
jgi:hypothetical protein